MKNIGIWKKKKLNTTVFMTISSLDLNPYTSLERLKNATLPPEYLCSCNKSGLSVRKPSYGVYRFETKKNYELLEVF